MWIISFRRLFHGFFPWVRCGLTYPKYSLDRFSLCPLLSVCAVCVCVWGLGAGGEHRGSEVEQTVVCGYVVFKCNAADMSE